MTEFVEQQPASDILECVQLIFNNPPQDEEPQKKRRGRPRIEDPDHYIKYRTQYYRDNATRWNEYQKQYIREKRRQLKIQKCLKFISEQVITKK